jgi:hypothetical protein
MADATSIRPPDAAGKIPEHAALVKEKTQNQPFHVVQDDFGGELTRSANKVGGK